MSSASSQPTSGKTNGVPTVLPVAHPAGTSLPAPDAATLRAGRIKLLLLFLLFASPVIASYYTYYVIQPTGRTNYGELIDPQRSLAGVRLSHSAADDFDWTRLRGKWVMVTALARNDEAAVADRLYAMRQVRLTTGKDIERIERVLVQLDGAQLPAALVAQHDGLLVLRASRTQWESLFGQSPERILMVDPLGNLMMRFPERVDPNKMKKDVSKLLRASRIG